MLPPLSPDLERRDWTVEQVRALPDDGNRYEVIDGELFATSAPAWLHQHAFIELCLRLRPYADRCGLDCLLAPAEVTFSPHRSVEPDLFVVPRVNGRHATRVEDVEGLLLAVEVISPTTVRSDRYRKRRLYQGEGVAEYWIVDPASRHVERWRPGDEEPEVLVERLVWGPTIDQERLIVDLATYFQAVHGE